MNVKKVILGNLLFLTSFIFAQPSVQTYYPQAYAEQQLVGKSVTAEKSLLEAKDQLENELSRMHSDPVLRYATWGFAVYDPQLNRLITSYNENLPLIPASTTKLLTTDTAYSVFGQNFQWTTQLEYSGEISPDGVLNGNLYIVGSGDPTLGTGQAGADTYGGVINNFREAIQNLGITTINGDIIVQTAVFKSPENVIPANIIWLEHNNYYLPVGSTANINPQNEKPAAKAKKAASLQRYFYISPYTKQLVYTDRIQGDGYILGELPQPPMYLANNFRAALSRDGIAVLGEVMSRDLDTTPEKRMFVAAQKSPSLANIVYYTNQNSNNRLAEALLVISGFYANGDCSMEGGRNAVINHLNSVGFDFSGLNYSDGSGLSKSNSVTPLAHVKFLAQLMKQPYFPTYFESLPIAGNTGTLKRMFLYNEANGQIFAKTGTLNRVKTLAGYIRTRSGRMLTFSLLINNYSGSVSQVKRRMEELLEPTLQL
ncbi:D-alanyl-D-alanine carboxypeptidase/D-alanyl-D-alanine-endopeptidase [Elizabethkingia argentiflava]|uniref:D-alanyl-D-alanine carboxypeptidase/D-alanyl-D-alanine-endopeptidase n=1 Tax=Elizabethkingia argenteiflava TaxID=2681556 RepID=A0A845PTF6_9FLAO|nr:D-alanyl-D-alanine carboxypeptidase/D-alanyl-D-alanine-endopeptidase [Elizabethkingia argenteiflava]NAW50206.1 D-alanyl-D-alanine carboxypeptidase/D-alanyl-D-alanine-endopeptidase [Elizabethkingia argenteiflava]